MSGDQIREVWDTRREEIVNRWASALTEIRFNQGGLHQQTHLTLNRILDLLLAALLSPDPLDRERCQQAGGLLTEAYSNHPSALRISIETLYTEFTHQILPDVPSSFIPRLGGLLGEFAAGYMNAANMITAEHQNHVRQTIENEFEQVEEELRSAYRAASLLLHPYNLSTMAEHIAQAVVDELKQVDCGVLLIDPETRGILRVARAGHYVVNARTQLHLDGRGLVSKAIRNRTWLYVSDVTQDSDYIPSDPRTRSEFVVPLRVGDQIIGVLDLQSEEVDAFSLRDRRIVEAFGERAAAAINNAQLREVLHKQTLELEERVQERTKQVEAILNDSSDSIVLINPVGVIQRTNPAFSHLFAYDTDEAIGMSLPKIIAKPYNFLAILRRVAETRQSARFDILATRSNGSTFPADIVLSPITKQNGQPAQVIIASIRDISEQKRREAELEKTLEDQRELNEIQLQFSAMMSHEFRTPLTAITIAGDMLEKYYERMSEERRMQSYQQIHSHVAHLTRLLDDILEFIKMQMTGMQFAPEPLEFVALCKNVIHDAQNAYPNATARIHFQSVRPQIMVYGMEKMLRLGIMNILTNAIKYSSDDSIVYFNVEKTRDMVVVTIQDQGIGIPEDEHQNLFRKFFYRAQNVGNIPGTGLGLALVKQVINQHNGTIWFESAADVGTTFYIHLPINQ